MGIAVIDFVFIGIVIIFALRCAVRGFVSEIMFLAAVVFGFLSAIFFFRTLAEFLRETFMPGVAAAPEVIAFAALFLLVFAVSKILESILRGILDGLRLGGLDRFLGAVLGFAEGIVVVCLVLFLITIQPFFDSDAALGNSFFAELLMPFIAGRRWDLPGMIAPAQQYLGGYVHV